MRAVQRRSMRRGALAAMVAVLFVAGCASSPPMRLHALVAIAPTAPAPAYDGPVLQIAGVRLPAELDRAEWLREAAPGRFEVRESDHWAAPLATLARQTLAEDLALRLPAGRTVFPGAAWPAAGAQLSVDILSYTLRDGVASMRLSWSLRHDGATATEAGAQWQLQAPAADDAAAFSALLGQLADRLAATLSTGPATMPR